ncbi:MAG TPA: hypothetical protein PKH31_11895, partial [Candidatus Sumerlaeota bacterium]|nr:hypothetical protein [Candidatus Sumerlaeota bacterium]
RVLWGGFGYASHGPSGSGIENRYSVECCRNAEFETVNAVEVRFFSALGVVLYKTQNAIKYKENLSQKRG